MSSCPDCEKHKAESEWFRKIIAEVATILMQALARKVRGP